MHTALMELLEQDLVYTDFKPEHVLVNLNNKKGSAFLTRLDSLVTTNQSELMEKICQITVEYFPPLYGLQASAASGSRTLTPSRLIDGFLKLEGTHAVDRLLTWQFCLSLYSLICSDEYERRQRTFADRSVFVGWKQDNQSFVDYLSCGRRQLSISIRSLFDGCLYRKTSNTKRRVSFSRLIEHEWFDDF